jgi:hypothetical protein
MRHPDPGSAKLDWLITGLTFQNPLSAHQCIGGQTVISGTDFSPICCYYSTAQYSTAQYSTAQQYCIEQYLYCTITSKRDKITIQ